MNITAGARYGVQILHMAPKPKKGKFSVEYFVFKSCDCVRKEIFLPQEKQKHLKWINQDKEPRYLIALFLEHLVFTLNPSAISLNC